jgi:hypothetical protein
MEIKNKKGTSDRSRQPKAGVQLPDGQTLPITEIRVKPRNKKYFALSEVKIRLYPLPSRPDKRAFRDRHERGAGGGGRW